MTHRKIKNKQTSIDIENDGDLMKSLESHSQSFDRLIQWIPSNLYWPLSTAEKDQIQLKSAASKFMHNKKEKAPKQAIKEASKRGMKKRAKLDPEAGAVTEDNTMAEKDVAMTDKVSSTCNLNLINFVEKKKQA